MTSAEEPHCVPYHLWLLGGFVADAGEGLGPGPATVLLASQEISPTLCPH